MYHKEEVNTVVREAVNIFVAEKSLLVLVCEYFKHIPAEILLLRIVVGIDKYLVLRCVVTNALNRAVLTVYSVPFRKCAHACTARIVYKRAVLKLDEAEASVEVYKGLCRIVSYYRLAHNSYRPFAHNIENRT